MRYCKKCGSPLEDGAKFCPECGAAIGGASAQAEGVTRKLDRAGQDEPETPAVKTSVLKPAAPYAAEPAAKKQGVNKALVAAAIVGAFALGAIGVGAYVTLSGNAQASSQQTAAKSEKTDAKATDSSKTSDKTTAQTTKTDSGTSSSSNSSASDQSSNTDSDSTNNDANDQARQQAAVDFCKTWWTNVTVKSPGDSEYQKIDDWVNRVTPYIDPSSSLYAELTRGKGADILDAEDICLNAEVESTEGNTVRVTVDIAAHRENPTGSWSTEPVFSYIMSVDFNDNNKVTGFTSVYTDKRTGDTYTVTY